MGKRLLFFIEMLCLITMFAFFSSFVITTQQNDKITDATENFVELVRYKGCVTQQMYSEFLAKMPVPVKVSFIIDQGKTLEVDGAPADRRFTTDVFAAIEDIGYYPMRIGDEVQVIVRKAGPSYFDMMVGVISGQHSGGESPIIAAKGGLVLNVQYD